MEQKRTLNNFILLRDRVYKKSVCIYFNKDMHTSAHKIF